MLLEHYDVLMRLPVRLSCALVLLAAGADAGSLRLLTHLGSVGGGDVVLIRADSDVQLSNPLCDPAPACIPRVSFGGVPARSVTEIDTNTLRVITPAHDKGKVDVTISGSFGTVTLPGAFAFDGFGGTLDRFNYEAVLIPILQGAGQPLPGMSGSSWISELWVRNGSAEPVEFLTVGYPVCALLCASCCMGTTPFPSLPAQSLRRLDATAFPFTPGNVYYVQRGGSASLTFSLRVRDLSHAPDNLGTEIPVVPQEKFASQLDLLNVPVESGSRTAMRAYGMTGLASVITLRILSMDDGRTIDERPLILKAGTNSADDLLHDMPSQASYGAIYDVRAEFPELPTGRYRFRLEANRGTTGVFWAFASATNNTTQLFTTITPQTIP